MDTYMDKFVPKHATTTSATPTSSSSLNDNDDIMPINYLSIDVEGYDYEVLIGANKTLPHVHYLEFEYNWVGAWKDTTLSQAIQHLDTEFGFTCYWAGFNDTIWRITNCWLDHYDVKFWSNVACVNRNAIEVRDVAHDMERLFNETLRRGGDAVRDYEHRFKRKKYHR